ncbi:MAG: TolC family protein [Acidobacteria bacterium]|jgi:outer membrane protein TolC|nr:TolC family protein [Acidobacteriota bacterium]
MSRTLTRMALFLLALVAGGQVVLSAVSDTPGIVRLGVVTDGEAARTAPIADRFRTEIRRLLEGEFVVEETAVVGDWTLPGVRAALERMLSDPSIDVVLAAGILASDEACRSSDLPKPVIAPFVLDASIQGCPLEEGHSGRANLVYATYPPSFASDIKVFRSIVPFERLAVVTSATRGGAADVVPQRIDAAGREVGVSIVNVVAGRDASETLAAIPANVDAVYFTPLLRLDEGEIGRLAEGLIGRRLPAFSGFSTRDVELGMLATNSPDTDLDRLARRTALNLQRILLGEPASTLPVTFARGEELTINMATARALGTYPPWALLTDARLLNEVRQRVARTLTLDEAVREARRVNLDLQEAEQAVAAGAAEVRRARAPLLPRLDVLGQGLVIDEDRAEASFGSQPERSVLASVELGQLIYSDDAWAAYEIEQRLQEARESERDRIRLDVTLETAAAYIDVLRAKTQERIARVNLRLTRENLERARIRTQIGVASPAEVYRWEARLAADRQAVISANAQRNKAEIQLNRILDRPGEEPFATLEVGLEDPSLITSDPRIHRYIDNPWIFRVFRAFHVEAAKQNSPELMALDAGIRARERGVTAAKRSFWVPVLGLRASLGRRLTEGGAGTGVGSSLLPPEFPVPNRTTWEVAIQASLPVFAGGERAARRTQAEEELARLRTERAATANRIEQRVRSALHDTGASYTAIGLARESAEAARRNLELVQDSYGRGVLSIIDLLDAQNAAITAEAAAANAINDFLLDLMDVERAVGRFGFFVTPAERQDYFDRLSRYVAEVEAAGGAGAGP